MKLFAFLIISLCISVGYGIFGWLYARAVLAVIWWYISCQRGKDLHRRQLLAAAIIMADSDSELCPSPPPTDGRHYS